MTKRNVVPSVPPAQPDAPVDWLAKPDVVIGREGDPIRRDWQLVERTSQAEVLEQIRGTQAAILAQLASKKETAPTNPSKSVRKRAPRQPNEREQAILNLPAPGQMSLEDYCHALDAKGTPFPEIWTKPKDSRHPHAEAWAASGRRRKKLSNERANVWRRADKWGWA
jgi:hypothetical protein